MKAHSLTWLGPVSGICLGLLSAQVVLAQSSPATFPDVDLYTSGLVYSMVRQDDGKIIVGGLFDSINGVPRDHIARLNPDGSVDAAWDPSADVSYALGPAHALAISGNNLYVGGEGGLAKLNLSDGRIDSVWHPAGSFDKIFAIAVAGTNLYAGGSFVATNGNHTLSNLVRLSSASPLTVDPIWAPNPNGIVRTLTVSGTSVYVGGRFTSFRGILRKGVAKVSLLGSGIPDPTWTANVDEGLDVFFAVEMVIVSAPDVFISGSFYTVGGLDRRRLAKVNTTNGAVDRAWNPFPSNGEAYFSSGPIALVGTNLFIGGVFADGPHLAKVSAIGSGESDSAWNIKLAADARVILTDSLDTSLLVGGSETVSRIDRISGTRDASFGALIQRRGGYVYTLARQLDGKIIIGGDFLYARTVPRANIARVNQDGTLDSTWAPKLDGIVEALAVSGTNIFVGGYFEHVGGVPRARLTKLTTTSDRPDPDWNPMGVASYVKKLAVDGTNLFIAGRFYSVGGLARTNLAKVSTLGIGAVDPVWNPSVPNVIEIRALATGNSSLFVGGSDGATGRPYLAKLSQSGTGGLDAAWDPGITNFPGSISFWFPPGVYALALDGNNLFIGGVFDTVGGKIRDGLAKISALGNGTLDTEWDPKPTNCHSLAMTVTQVAVSGTNVYVDGDFCGIGGRPQSGLAKLSTTGTGVADPLWHQSAGGYAIAVSGTDIYSTGAYYDPSMGSRYGLFFLPIADPPAIYQDLGNNVVIARNAADGAEVTHFRILGINGGTLYLNDGVTPINPGDFITVAQGAAGLRFGPSTNGSITAASSLNATTNGAGTATTTFDFSAPQPLVLSFDSASYSVAEDVSGSILTVPVRKLRPGATTISFAVEPGSAEPYDVENGTGDYLVLTSSPLTFGQTDTTKSIRLFINNDDLLEGDETFSVRLTSATGGVVAYPGIATITIIDDECPGQHGSFANAVLPPAVATTTGSLQVIIPEPATAQWRLSGDPVWRDSGSTATGLVPGFHEVLFKPVVGFRNPERVTVQIEAGSTTTFAGLYASQPTNSFGDLVIVITPEAVASNADPALRAQWRVSGGAWHDSGASDRLVAGFHTIEFKPVPNGSAPLAAIAEVVADQTIIRSVSYEPRSGSGPALPAVLSPETVTSTAPYCFNGLIETEDGFGSGVVVKERVVLTAAHVLFDDARLTFTKRVKWYLQKHKGDYEPVGQIPRGWYLFDGYAAQRTTDNSPGVSSPGSQNFDAAALFFVGTNASDNLPGRGGFGGFLASASAANEWLISHRQKMLVGYPLEGMAEADQGRMHATTPANLPFTKPYPQLNNQVYATTAIASRPGNSGGPVYVQADDGLYYPAGIYLGGGSQTLVRAIDEKVVCLINAAEISATGGGNNTGGGVALWSPGVTVDAFQVGFVRVTLGPTNALRAGAAWRVNRGGGDVSPYLSSSDTVYPLIPGPIPIEFKPVSGFGTPTPRIVRPVANSTVPLDVIYPAFRLSAATRLEDGAFQFTLTGATGRVYTIEASDTPTNWSVLATLTNRTGSLPFTNRPPPGSFRRFYRGREQ